MPSELHPDLSRYIEFFFSELQRVTGKARTELARLKVLAGVYVEVDPAAAAPGAPRARFGVPVTPHYLLHVANQPLARTGAGAAGRYATSGVQLTAGQYGEHDLFYMHELGDAVTDDRDTLRRILADVDGGPAWADALASGSEAQRRAAFGRPLAEITAVPAGAPENDPGALRALLGRHFTYDHDTGAYFAKWPETPGARAFPAGVAEAYKTKALREVVLVAGSVYCLGVVPERLLNANADEAAMREFVVRFDDEEGDTGGRGGATQMVNVYSVLREPRAANQASFHQFCFFHAERGQGVAIPDSAAMTLSSGLSALLDLFPRSQDAESYMQAAPDPEFFFAGQGQDLKVRLLGLVRPGAALSGLPAGVEVFDVGEPSSGAASTEPEPRHFLSPLSGIVGLAAHADVIELQRVNPARPALTELAGSVDTAGLRAAQTGRGLVGDGNGVMLGIIDTGIDGTHPAFAGRIHAVWDQSLPRQNPPTLPGTNFGRVLRGPDIATNSVDTNGHGTHVAGIAAGAAAPPDYTQSGVAPRAQICMVRLRDFGDDNILAGARWILSEATTAGRPCVINMSLGGHYHPHDGSTPFDISMRNLLRTSAGVWREGRLLVAASGNARQTRMHTHIDSLAPPTLTAAELPQRTASPHWMPDPAAHPEALTTFEVVVRPGTPGRFEIRLYGVSTNAAQPRSNLAVRVERAVGPGGWPGWVRQQPNNNFLSQVVANTRVRISNGRSAVQGIRESQPVVILESLRPGQPIEPGTWRIQIFNYNVAAAEVHGYALPSGNPYPGMPVFFNNPTEHCMIGSPACAEGVISVGSTVNRASWVRTDGETVRNEAATLDAQNLISGAVQEVRGAVSSFSCPGPVRRANRPLGAVAPGGGVASARSAQAQFGANSQSNPRTVVLSGTSMAAPAVTGLAACVLEQFPRITAPDFQTRLQNASTRPTGGSTDDWGPGAVDPARPGGIVGPRLATP